MIKVGVIGLGMMGQSHFLRVQASPLAQVVAVADADPHRLAGGAPVAGNIDLGRKALDLTGIARYADGADLIDQENVDVVFVCLPTPLHAPMSIRAARRGQHIFCEKPMARTLAQADAMIAAAQQAGVRLMVGQVLRFWPEYRYLKELVTNQKLGKLRSLSMSRLSSCPSWSWQGWILDAAQSGATIVDMHIHDVDAVSWVLGAPRAVSAQGWNQRCTDGIDVIESVLDYGPETTVRVRGGWLDQPAFGFEAAYDALFEGGLVRYNGRWERSLAVYRSGAAEPEYPDMSGDAYVNEVDFFFQCLQSGQDPAAVIAPEDARRSLELVLKLEESVRSGKAVTV
jgi:predicted dehydrogenase